jgi:hypothetical protein
MLASGDLLTPNFLECTVSNDKYKIVKRIFESEEIIAP